MTRFQITFVTMFLAQDAGATSRRRGRMTILQAPGAGRELVGAAAVVSTLLYLVRQVR